MVKSAFLCRQFMRGLPNAIRGRLLDHNPTPSLAEMLSFVQRYRAVEHHNLSTSASTTTEQPSADIDQLVGLMTGLVTRQRYSKTKWLRPSNCMRQRLRDRTNRTQEPHVCVTGVESKAILLGNAVVHANLKTVPACNATIVTGMDISLVNVETTRL